jgi:hypothetical protein
MHQRLLEADKQNDIIITGENEGKKCIFYYTLHIQRMQTLSSGDYWSNTNG